MFVVGRLFSAGRLGALPLRPGIDPIGEFTLGQGVGPGAERAFGELEDIALVHDGDALALVGERIFDRRAEQALGTLDRDVLDADAAGVGKADLGVVLRKVALQQFEKFPVVVGALLEFDAGIQVLGVLSEYHHIHLLRRLDRRGYALEPAHWAQADIQIEQLAQGDVQRADAPADRRGQRAFDRDQIFAAGFDGLVRQPAPEGIERLLAGIDLHPFDLAALPVRALDRGVEYAHAGAPDVAAGAVPFDEGDDRALGDHQLAVTDRHLLAARGHDRLDRSRILIGHGGIQRT